MGTFSQRLLINTDIMAKVHIKNGLFRVEGIKTANAKKEGREREKKRERKNPSSPVFLVDVFYCFSLE